MKDNELLLAISNIVRSQIEPIRRDIEDIKQDVKDQRQDIEDIKQDVESLKQDVRNLNLKMENDILPRLNTIEACYTSTYERYANGIDQLYALQSDTDILKKVVAEHSEKIKKIS